MNKLEDIIKEFDETAAETMLYKEENWATKDGKDLKSLLTKAFEAGKEEERKRVVEMIETWKESMKINNVLSQEIAIAVDYLKSKLS